MPATNSHDRCLYEQLICTYSSEAENVLKSFAQRTLRDLGWVEEEEAITDLENELRGTLNKCQIIRDDNIVVEAFRTLMDKYVRRNLKCNLLFLNCQ